MTACKIQYTISDRSSLRIKMVGKYNILANCFPMLKAMNPLKRLYILIFELELTQPSWPDFISEHHQLLYISYILVTHICTMNQWILNGDNDTGSNQQRQWVIIAFRPNLISSGLAHTSAGFLPGTLLTICQGYLDSAPQHHPSLASGLGHSLAHG